jgi:hypothetical protein
VTDDEHDQRRLVVFGHDDRAYGQLAGQLERTLGEPGRKRTDERSVVALHFAHLGHEVAVPDDPLDRVTVVGEIARAQRLVAADQHCDRSGHVRCGASGRYRLEQRNDAGRLAGFVPDPPEDVALSEGQRSGRRAGAAERRGHGIGPGRR